MIILLSLDVGDLLKADSSTPPPPPSSYSPSCQPVLGRPSYSLCHDDYSMVSMRGLDILLETDSLPPALLLPVNLSLDNLGIISDIMIILWSLGVGILQEADPSTPPTSFLSPCPWTTL
jgi:hypothetical protein